MKKTGLLLCMLLTFVWGGVIHAETFTADNKAELTVSVTEDAGPVDNTDQYYLTVNKGTNMQSVSGSGWYNKGTTATASGTAKATYTDSGSNYTVDSSNSGHRYYTKYTYTVNPVTKTMDSAQTATVTATESKSNGGGDQYYLTVNKDSGVASVTGAGWYNKGTTASATATYNTGYKAKSGTGSYTMNSAQTASVTSQKITYSVTYNYNCPSGWTNKGGLPSNQTKTYGTNLTLSSTKPAVPTKATDTSYTSGGTGYQYKKTYSATFKEWNTKADGSGTKYAAGATYSSNAAVTLYAIWTTSTGKTGEQYYLTITKGTGVASATSSQWVNKGSSVNVTATASNGYTINGGTGSTGAMTAAKSVSVTARKNKPVIILDYNNWYGSDYSAGYRWVSASVNLDGNKWVSIPGSTPSNSFEASDTKYNAIPGVTKFRFVSSYGNKTAYYRGSENGTYLGKGQTMEFTVPYKADGEIKLGIYCSSDVSRRFISVLYGTYPLGECTYTIN